jgi:hypothetical protein
VEVEAEAVIFSGEQVRRGCNLHGGDGVGSLTWIVRKSAFVLNGFGFFHSAGISQIGHLKGAPNAFSWVSGYENGGLLSSLLQRRKAGTCKRRNGMG